MVCNKMVQLYTYLPLAPQKALKYVGMPAMAIIIMYLLWYYGHMFHCQMQWKTKQLYTILAENMYDRELNFMIIDFEFVNPFICISQFKQLLYKVACTSLSICTCVALFKHFKSKFPSKFKRSKHQAVADSYSESANKRVKLIIKINKHQTP